MGNNPKKKKSHVPTRLNLLFFAVFILFSALILRLGVVQIVNGEEHVKVLERTSNVTARIDAPRGLMYDRYGNIVLDNELELSLTYTPRVRVSEEEKLKVAEKLEMLIEVDTSSVRRRDMQDFWILTRREQALEKVSPEERKSLDDREQYLLTLDRITDEDLADISEKEMRVLAIKREMDRGYALAPQRIKQGITLEEAHIVGENLSELPGVDILRDSTRKYVYGDTFRSFFGRTGSIPAENLDFYLSRGYDRSDIVGTSFLELQYEDVLRGQKAVVENITSRGSTIGDPNEKLGSRGNDLVLSIDMELQQRVEDIIREEVEGAKNAYLGELAAYVVMLDPRTGEVLALSGYNDHTGTVNKAFEMGSAIKGATVLTGFETGVVSHGSIIHDSPIKIGQVTKRSVRNHGSINDKTALEVSSNVYMFHIAMRIAGFNYGSQCCWGNLAEGYSTMRYYFSQFGLGVETGIDLPTESTGFNGGVQYPGNLLDLSIGQFDTYTPLQLAQYVATIANDGYRMKPQLVKQVREPSSNKEELGRVVHQFQPTVLNRIDMSDADIKRVQEGFRQVVTRGTASRFADRAYNPAMKTGTAQVRVPVRSGERTNYVEGNNQTMVGYAPYDNPKVAFSVVVPQVKRDNAPGGDGQISRRITGRILDTFFELEQSRQVPQPMDETSMDEIED